MKVKVLPYIFAFCALIFLILNSPKSNAQESAKWDEITNWEKDPRLEDHFWRKKLRIRIDLQEKINGPILESENKMYDEDSRIYNANKDKYDYRSGIIEALLTAYADGLIDGYNPDTLDNPKEFVEFRADYKARTDDGGGGDDDWGDTGGGDEGFEEDDDWFSDDFEDEGGDEVGGGGDVLPGGDPNANKLDFPNITKIIEIIENRIFDKNKSDMFYDMEYFILYCTGANKTDQAIVAFRYDDIKDRVLQKCMWKNRFNDAEYRTLKEVFELRIFNSIIINYSGFLSLGVDEADKRRTQMLEYEHNLWEF